MMSTPRQFPHHVWRLGPNPARWQQELARHQQAQPVFAIISGVSGGAWTPIMTIASEKQYPVSFPIPLPWTRNGRRTGHFTFPEG
jgi:hypothetical protein